MNTPKSAREAWELLRDHHLQAFEAHMKKGDLQGAATSASHASFAEWQASKSMASSWDGGGAA